MVQYIITPWRHPSQLLSVRTAFYPPSHVAQDTAAQAHAVDLVSVWMQRGNCPHSVESTAILTSARLNDEVGGNSNYCVRAAYAGAFSRFVTGLLDSHQTRKTKQSMYSLAKTLKPPLPATFVELRHQATHEELPSLPKLRSACTKALDWLYVYYWSSLPSYASTASLTESCVEFVKRVLSKGNSEERVFGGKWEEREVLEALIMIDDSTSDAATLLASTRLKKRLLATGSEARDGRSEAEASEKGEKNVEEMLAELARMQEDMADSDADESQEDDEGDGDAMDTEVSPTKTTSDRKGWQMWEGLWTPSPIGTIIY
ncbi:Las1-like-domain-containing protein [Calycina marina]|uniref:Las1-like-domain-containing protein n=1 Tax=Calycina marina TaxID=1763456 RepID=A0A9P8CJF3_9HELO|nr:Las1-like-domain-containing protein [Calycina marina]